MYKSASQNLRLDGSAQICKVIKNKLFNIYNHMQEKFSNFSIKKEKFLMNHYQLYLRDSLINCDAGTS